MSETPDGDTRPKLLERRKALGFTTGMTYEYPDEHRVEWSSRAGRKSFTRARGMEWLSNGRVLWQSLWMPHRLNWWIGVLFAIGSLLFCAGSLLALMPDLAKSWGLSPTGVNAVFFTGSIPFTSAAYLQLFQAANWRENGFGVSLRRGKTSWFGWLPANVGWLSSAIQFAGTVLFNINTWDAMISGMDWLDEDLAIWAPNMLGSICFIVSAYLAFAEESESFFDMRPADLSWWITVSNLLGCIAFLISAIFAFSVPGHWPIPAATISLLGTFVGAVFFFIGALLLLPESYEGEAAPDTA